MCQHLVVGHHIRTRGVFIDHEGAHSFGLEYLSHHLHPGDDRAPVDLFAQVVDPDFRRSPGVAGNGAYAAPAVRYQLIGKPVTAENLWSVTSVAVSSWENGKK